MLTTSLIVTNGCLITLLALLMLSNRITTGQYAGWLAVLSALGGVLSAVNGWTNVLYLNAVVTAVMAWLWWHDGGGDGTRRRLRSWARRFQGVRRTAPQGA